MKDIPARIKKMIKILQKGEITEYHMYIHIARHTKSQKNREILERIAVEEKSHYEIWTEYLGEPAKPSKWKLIIYKIMNFLLGYTFTLKVMEKGEDKAQGFYKDIGEYIEKANSIAIEEDEHEQELIQMLDEERLNYVGSMVLGLNDALVELTGTLAGLTFALGDTKLISLSGLVTGIAASLSMAASEYLSEKADGTKNAAKSALYTGIAYIFTVAVLIFPYLLLENPFVSLGIMLGSVVLIIFFFNFYVSVAKDIPFRRRFLQMAVISLGVAAISFGIGIAIKAVLGVDI